MFNYNEIKPRSEFRYWFTYAPQTGNYVVTDNATHKIIATVDPAGKVKAYDELIPADFLADVTEDYEMFKMSRPEYQIGRRLNRELLYGTVVNEEAIKLRKEEIDLYIIACCYAIYKDDTNAEKYAKRAITWLESTDFYTAPASTKYHECEFGGLVKHTLKVVDKTIELTHMETYEKVNFEEAILAAICHDFCKINFYTPYQKNVKNEETGVWEKELAFKYKGADIPLGHGTTSMFIAMKLFKLTTEQALAIRWHMNEYNVCESEKQDLMDANEKFRMVTMIQTADRLSII